ncbi:MAG: phage major capsid protein [Oscillospiraceae bacterium]|nr:phage major capsid protein [Oscillospiraceae bacterium]MDY2509461.1 phage major capsid protein [Ruminococcus callidus]
MYQNVTLEKGLYHLTNKSFVQALEGLDPSAQYADTPLAGLDAYERQLKRFDIRISGPQCDRVEKFFTSTESAVLFPEFVRRAVQQGMDASMLSEITAVETHTDSSQYLGCTITETDSYGTATSQSDALTASTILEATSALVLDKYGRVVKASYEAVRRQRLDVFAVFLRSVGMQLAQALMQQAITTLTAEAGSSSTKAGSALAYSDLATLYGKFTTYNMNTLLVSPKVAATILAMAEMEDVVPVEQAQVRLPFGTVLCKVPQMSDNVIIGLDKNFALEMVTGSNLILETDRLIENQLDLITVSLQCGFRVLMKNAVHKMTV